MSAPLDRTTAPLKADDSHGSGDASGAVVRSEPPDVAELNTLGDLHARAGDIDEATRCFERAGRAYKDAHFFGKALAIYKKLERLDDSNIDTKFSLAEVSIGLKRKREACKYFETVIDLDRMLLSSQRSIAILKGICDLTPSDTALRLELARTSVNGGFLFEAHEAYVAAAREFAKAGDVARSEASYLAALDSNSESRTALGELAELLIDDGRVADAVGMMRNVVDRNPLNADLLIVLGRTCRKADRLDDAEEAFLRLVDIDPAQARYLIEIGSRFASGGQIDRALGVVKRVSERASGLYRTEPVIGLLKQIAASDSHRDEALEQLAEIYVQIGDRANAVTSLERLLDRAHNRGDQEEAIALLSRLVQVAPDSETHRSRLYEMSPSLAPAAPTEVVEIELAVAAYSEGHGLEIVPEPEPPAPEPEPEPIVVREAESLRSRPPAEPMSESGGFAQWLEVVRRRKESSDATSGTKARAAAPRPGPPSKPLASTGLLATRKTAPLDGVVVVRGFDAYLDSEWRRAARASSPVSLLRIRIHMPAGLSAVDDKSWNESVLETLERTLSRPGDILLPCDRGDFVAVLPGTFREGAVVVARRMSATFFDSRESAAARLAIGIASAMPTRDGDKRSLVGASERALEAACESKDRLSIVTERA